LGLLGERPAGWAHVDRERDRSRPLPDMRGAVRTGARSVSLSDRGQGDLVLVDTSGCAGLTPSFASSIRRIFHTARPPQPPRRSGFYRPSVGRSPCRPSLAPPVLLQRIVLSRAPLCCGCGSALRAFADLKADTRIHVTPRWRSTASAGAEGLGRRPAGRFRPARRSPPRPVTNVFSSAFFLLVVTVGCRRCCDARSGAVVPPSCGPTRV